MKSVNSADGRELTATRNNLCSTFFSSSNNYTAETSHPQNIHKHNKASGGVCSVATGTMMKETYACSNLRPHNLTRPAVLLSQAPKMLAALEMPLQSLTSPRGKT